MPLNYSRICEWTIEDLFSEGQWCPVCGSEKFVAQLPFGEVYCAQCDAAFSCRHTTGDPGVVIDCDPAGYKDGVLDTSMGGYKYLLPFIKEPIALYQVLKPCNSGLDDRDHWCCPSNGSMYLTKNKGPIGKEVFRFDKFERARDVLHQQKVECPTFEEIEKVANTLNFEDGYYTEKQCQKVFRDDCYWVHRCIPLEGAKPINLQEGG